MNGFIFHPVEGAKYRRNYEKIARDLNVFRDKNDWKKAIELIRKLCWDDLFFLMYFVLGWGDMNHPWLVDRANEVNDNRHKTLDVWSRYHYKSSIITVAGTIQDALRDPMIRGCIFSHTKSIAKDFLRRIKTILETNGLLAAAFEDVIPANPMNTKGWLWSLDDGLQLKCGNEIGGTLQASGLIDSMPTGKHFTRRIYDDVVTREAVSTSEQRNKVSECVRLSHALGDPKNGTHCFIGTRYHFGDFYGELIRGGGYTVREYACTHNGAFPAKPVGVEDDVSPLGDGRAVLYTQDHIWEEFKNMGTATFACLPAYTRILMGDFSIKPIHQIRAGEEVLGIRQGCDGEKTRFVKSLVKNTFKKEAALQTVCLSNGDEVDCTPDHKWWSGRWRSNEQRNDYSPVGLGYHNLSSMTKVFDFRVGYDLLSDEQKRAADYLAGMIDGEGSVSGGLVTITQSHEHNPRVCKKIEDTLDLLGIQYGVYIRSAESQQKYNRGAQASTIYYLKGGRQMMLRLINICDCVKRDKIIDGLLLKSCHVLRRGAEFRVKIDSIIKRPGLHEVFALETETGNYIAEGYVSSNSQMLMDPIKADEKAFDVNWIRYYNNSTARPHTRNFIFADPAGSKKEGSAYTVMWVVGVDQRNYYYILDCVRDRLDLQQKQRKLFDLVAKWKVIKVYYEKYSMQGDIEYIEEKKREEGFHFPIEEVGGTRLSKDERILKLQPLFQEGRMIFPEKLPYTDCNGKLRNLVDDFIMEEYNEFPVSQYKDMLDALSRLRDEKVKVAGPAYVEPATHETDNPILRWHRQSKDASNGNSWLNA